ncbi:hypothetical protein [Rhizobium wuzhouense]|uniref:hypothetical protein n=1 Tax=Rhizobium wuzhouense TaxID=1986026 RepID=UPI001057C984|nr:hypothetical protein [Rhizobium wuzhouense]
MKDYDRASEIPLSTLSAIVAVVKDPALLRSISFALNTHGQTVEQFNDWTMAAEAISHAQCVILDTCLPPADLTAGLSLASRGVKVVVLAEDDRDYEGVNPDDICVLSKPLKGPDIANAVSALRKNP